ncbi:porin [Pseudomonas sp. NPDC089554]|uniref:porin n=1 Tax=Pseudomonas sp. NPDC089554 TaxID=3390653 RepID=UPI003D00313D
MSALHLRHALLPALLTLSATTQAVQVTDHLDVGGAIRARFDHDPDRDIDKAGLDAIMLRVNYDSDTWIGAARYRFYGKAYPYQYTDKVGDVQFAEYAWVGYKFDENRQLHVGLNKIPFGLQPFFGSTFYETLGNVIGLEDVEAVGAKYIQQSGDWNLQLGLYGRNAWPGRGTSNGSTYSSVVTKADDYVTDGSNNQERQIAVARLAYAFKLGGWQSEAGISGLTSRLENRDTNDDGRRNVVGVHYLGQNGPWGIQALAARQQMSPRNAGSDEHVTFGGYDGTYNVASRGNLYVGDLSYSVPGAFLGDWVSGVKLYGNYSRYDKSAAGFDASERFILGTSFSVRKFYIALEWLNGRNDPYIGGSSYTDSLAQGGTDHWENQLYMNIGYYF